MAKVRDHNLPLTSQVNALSIRLLLGFPLLVLKETPLPSLLATVFAMRYMPAVRVKQLLAGAALGADLEGVRPCAAQPRS